MGKTFSVETNPKSLDEIFSLCSTDKDVNAQLITSYGTNKHLRIWQFYENTEMRSEVVGKFVLNTPFNLLKASKEDFLLKPDNSYIILLSYHCNDSSSQLNENELTASEVFSPSLDFEGESEILSNITKRGLEYIFSSDINNELLDFSERRANLEYKYIVYLWNGHLSNDNVKSMALLNAHKLSKILGNQIVLSELCKPINCSHFTLPSDLRSEKESPKLVSKSPSPNKKRRSDNYRNFKSTFICLSLREEPNSKESGDWCNEIERELPLMDSKEKYYKLFESFSNPTTNKVSKKSGLTSRKKNNKLKLEKEKPSCEREKTDNLSVDGDCPENDDLDDLENDICFPSNNFGIEDSTTAISNNLSLKLGKNKECAVSGNENDPNQDLREKNVKTSSSQINRLNLGGIGVKQGSFDNAAFTFNTKGIGTLSSQQRSPLTLSSQLSNLTNQSKLPNLNLKSLVSELFNLIFSLLKKWKTRSMIRCVLKNTRKFVLKL